MNRPQFNRPSGVLFDLDGTLIDAFAPIVSALNQTLQEFGRPTMTPEAIKRHTGQGGSGIRPLFPERIEEAGARFLELHDKLYLHQISVIESSQVMLQMLADHAIPAAVVTSKGEERAKAQIELLDWSGLFQAIIGRVDGRPEKPSPVPVRLACEAIGRTPGECIFIGDGIGDMKAGRDAGIYNVGIADSFSETELFENGADICFNSLSEVYRWLKSKID